MNILKSIFGLFFLICSLYASTLEPTYKLQASGGVNDMVIANEALYVATSSSRVDIFNLSNQQLIKSIQIPKIKDFMGDVIDSKIYSVDILKDKILILSQGEKGGRNIDIYRHGKLENIISDKKRMFIAKAKFVDDEKIVFSLLSNQLYLYDLKNKKNIYVKQVSQSKFSNFVLNENKKEIIIADESGDLQQYEVTSGQHQKSYKGQNLDNVFQVDYKNNIIITAGQDRRAVVYSKFKTYYKQSDFLIYSCGLSPSANRAAYSSNENNDVTVFNTKTKRDLYTLLGNKMTLNNILFINEKEILIASDDKNINYYKLKQ